MSPTKTAAGVGSKTDETESAKRPDKVSRREFTARFARRAGVPLPTAAKVYEAMIDELIELTSLGHDVTLTGFGRFYTQEHKGHSVQFAKGKEVKDYTVLKFSATREVNRQVSGGGDDGATGDDE